MYYYYQVKGWYSYELQFAVGKIFYLDILGVDL